MTYKLSAHMKFKKLNVVELYAGIGQSVRPFRRWRRCNVSLLLDINQYAKDTYLHNFPKTRYEVKDLAVASSDWIRSKAGGRVDVLLGCPPCQGFSDNGRRSPWDFRNRHLRTFGRLAVELQPLAIGMENVPLAAGARAFADFTAMLEAAGYVWTAGIVNAALHGSCQCRQRLLLTAIRKSLRQAPIIGAPTHGGRRRYFDYATGNTATLRAARTSLLGTNPATFQVRALLPQIEYGIGPVSIPTVGETLAGLPQLGSARAQQLGHIPWAHTTRQLRRMAKVTEGGQLRISQSFYASSYGRLHRNGLARTITCAFPNAGSGRYWHPTENRSLTLREAARAQGIDDSFEFLPSASRAAFLVGNALDAALADLSYHSIRSCLD